MYVKINVLDEDIRKSNFDSLSYISEGNNRKVYRIEDKKYGSSIEGEVVKVGSYENEMEVLSWDYCRDKGYKKYVVPIIEYANDYEWIIMPYGEPVEPELVDQSLYSTLMEIASDIDKDDFIYHNGRQKCCDYASIITFI
jgi:hypothetical protein